MSQQAATFPSGFQFHLAKAIPIDVRDAVVRGEAFVEPGAVCAPQFKHAAVVLHNVFKEQARFHAQRFAQVVIEVGKKASPFFASASCQSMQWRRGSASDNVHGRSILTPLQYDGFLIPVLLCGGRGRLLWHV